MHNKIYIPSLIPSDILQNSYFGLKLNPTKTLLCNTIYHYINAGFAITPQNLKNHVRLNIKTIYENLKLIETGFVFQKIKKDCGHEEWISLLPKNKYYKEKKSCESKNKKFVIFYFKLPATNIVIQFYLPISQNKNELFYKINDREYYLIEYNSPQIEYLPSLDLIIIQAYDILNLTSIKSLGFNINDQGRPYLIDKDSIIEEEA